MTVGVLAAGILDAAGLVAVGTHLVLALAANGDALGIGGASSGGARELELARSAAGTITPDTSSGDLSAV